MKKLFTLFLSCISILFSVAQNPLVKVWDWRYGGTDHDVLYSFKLTSDGGYIAAGISSSRISGDKTDDNRDTTGLTVDFWIVKMDSSGMKEWDKSYGGNKSDALFSFEKDYDGGYVMGGYSLSSANGDKTENNRDTSESTYDYWVVKVDSFGNKKWDKTFGGVNDESILSINPTLDHGYILCGYSKSNISGDKTQANWDQTGMTIDLWIIKIDSIGNKIWDKDFGTTGDDAIWSSAATYDGGFLIAAFTESGINGNKSESSRGDRDYWILKIDATGTLIWDKTFGGASADNLFAVKQTPDSGFVLLGTSASPISGDKSQDTWGGLDYWMIKVDSVGNKQWDKDYGGIYGEDDYGTVELTNDGGYLITGASYSNISGDKTENNLGTEQTWCLKVDSAGTKQFDKTVFTGDHDEAGFGVQSPDGCFTIANYTRSQIAGYKTQPPWNNLFDFWIVKFCDSTLYAGIHQPVGPDQNSEIVLSPNPATNQFAISSTQLTNGQLEIYNSLGEKIYSSPFDQQQKIDCENFPKGIYFVTLSNSENVLTKKLLVD
jgi:hypothetical protein